MQHKAAFLIVVALGKNAVTVAIANLPWLLGRTSHNNTIGMTLLQSDAELIVLCVSMMSVVIPSVAMVKIVAPKKWEVSTFGVSTTRF